MRHIRVILLAAVGFLVSTGMITAQGIEATGQAEPQPVTIGTLPEALGVCGPIHRAILNFGPKDDEGVLDTSRIAIHEDQPDFFRMTFPLPQTFETTFGVRPPVGIRIHEYKGKVQAGAFFWPGTEEEKSVIRDVLLDQLAGAKGPPEKRDDGMKEWRIGEFRTGLVWPEKEADVVVFFSCLPTEDEFFAARDAAVPPESESAETAKSKPEQSVPDIWRKPSIVPILLSNGQPSEDPHEIGEDVVGFHFGGLNFEGTPFEFWYWFFEGKSFYSATEFLPIDGSASAVTSFEMHKKTSISLYGEPDEIILGEEGYRQRLIWRNGPKGFTLTFFEGDGNPWFLLESYDTTHLDKVDIGLRPSSTLPKRYEPPPPDSGLTRKEAASGDARG